jgi:M6 family metalloprotease-like protein
VRLTPPVPIAGIETGPGTPLDFSRAWLEKAERVRQRRAELTRAGKLDGVAPDSLARLGAALSGKLRIPVIPVRYSNVAAPFPHTLLQDRIFGGATGDSVSFANYWKEVSGGLLEVEGGVTPWVRLRRPGSYYLPKEEYGWASFGRAHDLVRDALAGADKLVDFAGFDNDGPDGVPNSGDDDGFIDLVVILYAVSCQSEWREGSVWPHRGAIPPIRTNAKAANGERLQVSDYLILPVQEPGTCDPLKLGTLAHETGHALGLPDLYDYEGGGRGAGAWDLMGTGGQSAPHSPAHLSAWAKEQLGWVAVEWIRPGQESLRLPPVVRERTVLRYDLPGPRGEYLLLENRQRLGSDRYIPGTGLLAWRIDPDRAALSGWNGVGRYPGVELIRASGRTTGAGNAADPFPGTTRRDHLELETQAPLRLSAIREEGGGTIVANVATDHRGPALSAAAPLRLAVLPGDTALSRTIPIRRLGGAAGNWTPTSSATWATATRLGNLLQLTADPTGLAPGIYTDTIHFVLPGVAGVAGAAAPALKAAGHVAAEHVPAGPVAGGTPASPAPNGPRAITPGDTTLAPAGTGTVPAGTLLVQLEVADPTAPAIFAADLPWGWGLAVRQGELFQASFGRDALSLRPRPRLLRLRGRDQATETLSRLQADAVYAPVAGPHGSIYLLGQANGQNQLFRVQDDGATSILTALPGSAPIYGAAHLADGRLLVADWNGKVSQVTPDGRVAPWIELDRNIYQIAVDDTGALYAAAANGNLLRLDPASGRLATIPTGFGNGRLVTVTATPDGTIFAAERGGQGRILRVTPAGNTTEVARIDGAEFYGLAADHRFLYALDLANRQVLRFTLGALTRRDTAVK